MKNLALLMATVTGLGFAAMAQAQTALPEIVDTDGSGAWSLGELQTVWPDITQDTFTAVDANTDGSVDNAELTAAIDAGVVVVPTE